MKAKLALWVLGLSLFGVVPAFATGVSVNFGSPTTISGDTATYTFDSQTITATGYQCLDNTLGSCSTAGMTLAKKDDSGGETGLGIVGGPHGDNEIESNDFLQLNFSQLASLGITNLTMQIQSVQNGEGFRLFQSNTAGMIAGTAMEVTGNGSNNPGNIVTTTFAVNFATNPFIDVSALNGNAANPDVLLGSAANASGGTGGGGTNVTPEPGTLALFGTGLLALGCVVRRYAAHAA